MCQLWWVMVIYIYIYTEGTLRIMDIIVRKEIGASSSNPGLVFPFVLMTLEKV